MAQYLLLLHENPSDSHAWTPETIQLVLERYRSWGLQLTAEGKLRGGHKLTEEGGRHLRREGGEIRVADGPYSEAKEVMGGFYHLEAADYDEAVAVAQTCPHLDHGWIEVRQIDLV
jgi:hypothetical protein